jgi:hypothetical protein
MSNIEKIYVPTWGRGKTKTRLKEDQKMRQFTLSAAMGIALAALLSAVPAMAQAYNTDRIGWNRGGEYIVNTTGKDPQCFKGSTGKFDGPQLQGKSDAATHGWQNFWGPCGGASKGNSGASGAAPAKRTAKR